MSSQLFCKVLVFALLHLYANAYVPYPYPYAQQFDYNYQPSHPQLYPQVSIPNYGQQFQPYPSNYPIYPNYQPAPQTLPYGQIPQGSYLPLIPAQGGHILQGSYPPVIPTQGEQIIQGSYPQVIPTQGGQILQGSYSPAIPVQGGQIPPQGGVYPSPFPYMPQSYVQTPYGNIPVEIIDVNPNQETGVINPETLYNSQSNETKTETSSGETSITEENENVDIVRKPVITSSVVQSSPQSTTITRTLDPRGGKINVIVQTSKPPLKKQDNSIEKEDGNAEDNETTTKKYYNIFGR